MFYQNMDLIQSNHQNMKLWEVWCGYKWNYCNSLFLAFCAEFNVEGLRIQENYDHPCSGESTPCPDFYSSDESFKCKLLQPKKKLYLFMVFECIKVLLWNSDNWWNVCRFLVWNLFSRIIIFQINNATVTSNPWNNR